MSQTLSMAAPAAAKPSKATLLAMSIFGTMVEYFDYSLYGFLAVPLSQYFFPQQDASVALLQAFGVFAIGSMAKPLGALIFGRIGDLSGRRIALKYSFLGISVPTLTVGCMPGYEQIGMWTVVLLILCRFSQGVFVSGESDGVRIYLQEHFSSKNHALVANLAGAGAYLGITLASFTAAMVAATDWWRLPFFISAGLSFTVLLARQVLVETPVFEKTHIDRRVQVYTDNWQAIVRTMMVCGASGGAYHVYLVFWGAYQSKVLGYISTQEAVTQTSLMAFVYTVMLPIVGYIADRVGLDKVVRVGAVCVLWMIVANMLTFGEGGTPFIVLLLTAASISVFAAPCFVLLTRQFDPAVRYRCLSLGHALGSMLFSGSTPAINMALWSAFQWEMTPLVYFAALMCMGFAGMAWLTPRTLDRYRCPA